MYYTLDYRREQFNDDGEPIGTADYINLITTPEPINIYNCAQAILDGEKEALPVPAWPPEAKDEHLSGHWHYYVTEYDRHPDNFLAEHLETHCLIDWMDDNKHLKPESLTRGDKVTLENFKVPHDVKSKVCVVTRLFPISGRCYIQVTALGKRGNTLKAERMTRNIKLSDSHRLIKRNE